MATPSWNSDQAGAVVSIGRVRSMPVRDSNQASKAATLPAKGVGFSSASSGGSTQAGLALPASVLQSGRCQTACCCSRKAGADAVLAAELEEHAVAMEDLADQVERAGQLRAAVAGDRHAPRHLREAELLLVTRAAKAGSVKDWAKKLSSCAARVQVSSFSRSGRTPASSNSISRAPCATSSAFEPLPTVTQTVRPGMSFHSETPSDARADDGGLGPVVVRPDEARLAVALGVVAHGGDGEVDAVLGQQRDAGRRVDADELDLDAELAADRQRHVDLVALARLAGAGGEQRIVVANADADAPGAEDADQSVGIGLRAGARQRGARRPAAAAPARRRGICPAGRAAAPW